jgi:hypothetical protein
MRFVGVRNVEGEDHPWHTVSSLLEKSDSCNEQLGQNDKEDNRTEENVKLEPRRKS